MRGFFGEAHLMADKYNPQEIERKWQDKWAETGIYQVKEDPAKPKYYALTMFPYTSGDLHVGHWYAMAPSDVRARFKRMQGFNVLHPMGFDSFGLPAENAAIKRSIHPFTWTMQNIANMRRQLMTMGSIYDWSREVITCLPEYYKWTQWFFLKMYEHGLAYRAMAPVNWCPSCQTVLANEQVVGEGATCERCDTPVIHKYLEQWFFRITKYADELAQHEGLNWPERIKTMQHNWVGRSEGAEIVFPLEKPVGAGEEIRVFTTRPDTVYGVTFMVLAPEHRLVNEITTPAQRAAVEEYIDKARHKDEMERLSTEREKDGVFTGAYAVNQLNGEKVPIWIADYVILSYGTGAVMGVPAHDERDFAFAKKYNLPIRLVIVPHGYQGEEFKAAYVEPGTMLNSGPFDGQSSVVGWDNITAYIERHGWGKRAVSYKLRDWLISRQRYWGAPIPIIYCEKCGAVPVPEKDLPVLLPEDAEFKPTGESPLKYNEKFARTTCPKCGGPARRETDTMDTFMCSSWYYLRYASPHDDKAAFDKDTVKYWLPVDLYTGGAEHAVMHLFYARFFTKALRDMGLVNFGEPFTRLFNQGTIINQGAKMSKSRGNVINPDKYVGELGADTVRTYLMFVGPWEQGGEWSDSGISGSYRWLNRVWNLTLDDYTPDARLSKSDLSNNERDLTRTTHQTIKKATGDNENLQFNTMIAALMEYTNYLNKVKDGGTVSQEVWKEATTTLLLLLAPVAPHITEELWQRTGRPFSIHNQQWPAWSEELAREEEITLVVQVNGKVRERLTVPASITEDEAKKLVLANERVKSFTQGKEPANIVYVPGRLINLVVK
jgi:leucyl-tRNA synthetase